MALSKPKLEEFNKNAPKDGNPFSASVYWMDVLNNHVEEAIGCSIPEFEKKTETCVERMVKCSEHLDKITRDAKIAIGVAIAGKVAGAGMFIAGMILIPFTFGGSLGLSVAGGGVFAAALTTAITAQLVKAGWKQSDSEEAKKATDELVETLSLLNDLLSTSLNSFTETYAALLLHTGKDKLKDAIRSSGKTDDEVAETADVIAKVILGVCAVEAANETARGARDEYINKSFQKAKQNVWGPLTDKDITEKDTSELSSDLKVMATILQDLSKTLTNIYRDFTKNRAEA